MTPLRAILFNDTRVDLHHGCNAVVGAIGALCARHNIEIIHCVPAHSDWRQSPRVLEMLGQVDLVIVNGEGTLHHDRPAARVLLEVGRAAAQLGVPSALINFGWEENGPELFAMLQYFNLLACRDETAAREIRNAGVSCMHVPDLSLMAPFSSDGRVRRRNVGFTDSVLRDVALELAVRCSQSGGTAVPIRFAGHGLRAATKFVVRSIPKAEVRNPARLARIVQYRIGELFAQTADTSRFLDALAGLQTVVSGRFHACTLCLVTGTPFVAIGSNTSKIQRLIGDAGLNPRRFAPTVQEAMSRVAALDEWSDGERMSLDAYLSTARVRADELFSQVAALAGQARDRQRVLQGPKA